MVALRIINSLLRTLGLLFLLLLFVSLLPGVFSASLSIQLRSGTMQKLSTAASVVGGGGSVTLLGPIVGGDVVVDGIAVVIS